ncbi:MAG TPA: sortase [Patescibacteria group bacterium]|jgi:sortase A|nr:sortase [Patescibacteria group bacterium]
MADEENKPSTYIASSDQIRSLLNLDGDEPEVEDTVHDNNVPADLPVAGNMPSHMPFLEHIEEPIKDLTQSLQAPPEVPAGSAGPIAQIFGSAGEKGNEAYAFVLWAVKSILPYIVIFAIGIGLYFFYFSDVSFTNIFKSSSITLEKVTTTASDKDLDKLKADQKANYLKWMSQFFFAVNDDAIVSMDADVSGNGLTNFEKYLLDLNPKVYSTRGTDKPDGQLVIEGINPWTGKPFTDKQKELVSKYINTELISNRITAAALNRGVTKFAEYVNPGSPYYVSPDQLRAVQNANPTISSPEVASEQTAYQASQHANPTPTTTANLNPNNDINQNIPGKIDIPSVKVSVPLTWTKDVKDFDNDLKKGTVHYPGTVLPGQLGTAYISGHSSGYIWDHSAYKQIFAVLGQVKDGDSFTITVTLNSGKQAIYHYVVSSRGEFQADDQAQFANTADSVVALSTCWPVGTTARRLVLFAKLTQTEI